jgi:heme-degrading monooxygenase HmoA
MFPEVSMIIRVFRALVHDGMQDEFAGFFRDTAIPLLEYQPGMMGLTVGLPMRTSPNEFMMTTVWSDLESLKEFAGENWADAVIDPAEAHLLRETFVHHYESA